MNKKAHDIIRTLQWLIPALLAFYAALDEVFGWASLDAVNKIAMALVALLGVIAEKSSRDYFKNDVVIKPKEFTPEEIEEIMKDE